MMRTAKEKFLEKIKENIDIENLKGDGKIFSYVNRDYLAGDNKKYMNIIFESVYTPNWFYAIWGIVDSMGGWINLNTEYKQKAMVMCFRTFSIEPNIVLNKLELALNLDDEEDCKHLSTLLQYNTQKCDSKKLIAFYNKLVKFGGPSEYTSILKNILIYIDVERKKYE